MQEDILFRSLMLAEYAQVLKNSVAHEELDRKMIFLMKDMDSFAEGVILGAKN